MRTQVLVPLSLIALVACGGGKQQSGASASPGATPVPLRACETREMTLERTDMIVQANIDGTTASIEIVHAPDPGTRDRALAEARKTFGDPHPDTRTMTHQGKWGIPSITDPCGRPVTTPSTAPSA